MTHNESPKDRADTIARLRGKLNRLVAEYIAASLAFRRCGGWLSLPMSGPDTIIKTVRVTVPQSLKEFRARTDRLGLAAMRIYDTLLLIDAAEGGVMSTDQEITASPLEEILCAMELEPEKWAALFDRFLARAEPDERLIDVFKRLTVGASE